MHRFKRAQIARALISPSMPPLAPHPAAWAQHRRVYFPSWPRAHGLHGWRTIPAPTDPADRLKPSVCPPPVTPGVTTVPWVDLFRGASRRADGLWPLALSYGGRDDSAPDHHPGRARCRRDLRPPRWHPGPTRRVRSPHWRRWHRAGAHPSQVQLACPAALSGSHNTSNKTAARGRPTLQSAPIRAGLDHGYHGGMHPHWLTLSPGRWDRR